MKNKLFGFALAVGLGFGLNSAVSAQDNTQPAPDRQERMGGKNKMGKMRGEKRGGRLGGLQQLNLTGEQREQIRSIRQNSRGNQESRREMQTLAQARRDGTLNQSQQDRLRELREQRRAENERIQQQIISVLTPEQRRQWEEMRSNGDQQMNERRRNRRQNRQMDAPIDN